MERDWNLLEVGTVNLPDTGSSRFIYGLTQNSNGELYMTKGARILKLTLDTMAMEFWAGSADKTGHEDGPRLKATLDTPLGVLWHNEKLYFAQSHSIRIVDAENVVTLCGSHRAGHNDGPWKSALFNNPTHIAELHNTFYVTDSFNHCIRIISPDGTVGSIGRPPKSSIDGTFTDCGFKYPRGICIGPSDQVLVIESSGSTIRMLDLASQTVTPFPIDKHTFRFGIFLTYCFSTQEILIADTSADALLLVSPQGKFSDLVSLKRQGPLPDLIPIERAITARPTAAVVTPSGDLYWTEEVGGLRFIRGMFPSTENCILDLSMVRLLCPNRGAGVASSQSTSYSSSSIPNSETNPNAPSSSTSLASTSSSAPIPSDVFNLITHRLSGQEFSICLPLCNVLGVGNINAITTTHVPLESVESFVSLLYGSTNLSKPTPSIELLCHLLILSKECQCHPELIQWLTGKVNAEIAVLSPSKLVALASIFGPIEWKGTIIGKYIAKAIKARTEEIQPVLADSSPELVSISMSFLDISTAPSSSTNEEITSPSENTTQLPQVWTISKWWQSRFVELAGTLQIGSSNDGKADLAHENTKEPSSLDKQLPPPNFVFCLESPSLTTGPVTLAVHDWILYGKWSYFRRMIDAGFDEAINRQAYLAKDFSPPLLLALVKYLYSGFVDITHLDELECEYIIENGGEYGIFDLEGNPAPEFKPFIRKCQTQLAKSRAPPAEPIIHAPSSEKHSDVEPD